MSWTRAWRPGATRWPRYLRDCGLKPGDRVVAYLPNSPEAVIAMLATVSIGADLGELRSRFRCPRGRSTASATGAKARVRRRRLLLRRQALRSSAELRAILGELPSASNVSIYLRRWSPTDPGDPEHANTTFWEQALAGPACRVNRSSIEQVPFAHPLWILFSSGTTGLPKPIVHCHGGITLEQFKSLAFHMDLHARERMFFYHDHRLDDVELPRRARSWSTPYRCSTTAIPPIPSPTSCGRWSSRHPCEFLRREPDLCRGPRKGRYRSAGALRSRRAQVGGARRLAGDCRVHGLGLSQRESGCLGWHSGSGGTDICSGLVGGVVTLPVYAGEIQARQLGVAAYAFDERGQAVVRRGR